jgi:hypothetical protein
MDALRRFSIGLASVFGLVPAFFHGKEKKLFLFLSQDDTVL